jgi:hypothetical protein
MRAPGALTWTQKREILQQNRIIAPTQPPSEFELTPRAPHRLPGGYLSVGTSGMVLTRWNPNSPDDTGDLSLTYVSVVMSGLRRNTNYLFDLFVSTYPSSGTAKLTVRACAYGGRVAAEFPITGAGHVFVVLPTNANGGGCFALTSDASASLFRVQASELGAVP